MDPVNPFFYTLTTGNDTGAYQDRNWGTWYIYGANFAGDGEATKDAEGWVLIDATENIGKDRLRPVDAEPSYFGFSTETTVEYTYYKVVVTKAYAGDAIQMNELRFGTEEEFEVIKQEYIAAANEFDYDVTAEQKLIDEYEATITEIDECVNMEALFRCNYRLAELRDLITASAETYDIYIAKVEEAIAYLEDNPLAESEALTIFDNYLNETIEVSELYPNGSAQYIIENHLLADSVVIDEIEFMESLKAAARKLFGSVCVDITEPLEVSFMLDNADMVGSASAKPWHNGSPAFGWEEFEVYHATFTLEQEATLPLGTYDLGFHSLYREDGSGSAPTLTVTTNKGKYTGRTPLMGSIDYGVTNATDNNWVSRNGKIEPNGMQSCGQALAHGDAMAWARDIVVDAAGNMAIKYAVTSSAQWVNWQGFRLVYKGLSRDELAASLKAVIDEATALYADGTGVGAVDLQSAIDAATDVYGNAEATNKDVKEASDALLLAMKSYRYANASVENPIDKTDLIVNPSFEKQKEGWSTANLATQTNTSFTKKAGSVYLEKWTGSGNKVGDAQALQVVQGLDMGVYQLVVAAQNIQQNATNASQSGAWIVANDARLSVGKTDDYTLTFVNIESNATIGFEAVGATGNWIAVDNFRLYYVGGSDADYKAELQRYIDAATALVDMKMHAAALDALKACIVAAQDEMAKGSTAGYIKVSTPLREAAETAQVSIDAYAALQAAITKAEEQYGEGQGLGAEDFMAAINAAKAAYADGATTYEELAHQIELLDQAAFNYMLGEPTGPVPTITKTDQRYARGSVMAFGRFTYNLNGAKLREAGFCYATEKAPTVDDQRSTRYFDNNGRIYIMDNMQPSTVYYARPYVVTEGYQVAYGDEIKIITLPKGGMTWSWNNGGSAEENERISGAIRYGMEVWNMFISLHGFHLTGNYGSGTPTADCSYGGWMRVGPNASYQRTGTIMHEAAHGVGVGTHWTWGTIMQGGAWTGSRANQVLQFWNNNTTETMRGDGTHMWPYGINGAHEDDGTDFLYYGNALIIQGLHEDGLQPTDATFASPAYTFGHDDEVKYYIKNESASYGLNTSYLTVEGTVLKWSEATSACRRQLCMVPQLRPQGTALLVPQCGYRAIYLAQRLYLQDRSTRDTYQHREVPSHDRPS